MYKYFQRQYSLQILSKMKITIFIISVLFPYISSYDVKTINVEETSNDISFDNKNNEYENNNNLKIFNESKSNDNQEVVKKKIKNRFPLPFLRLEETNETTECPSSVEDFPSFISVETSAAAAVIVAVLIVMYCFTLIAVICDNYFIPSVEKICEALNLSEDVGAAIFMSIATSAPELFTNVIGTFITQSDMGIGTIVGSSMFNTLGVPSVGGLAAAAPIQIAWWPLTRDCFMYMIAVSCLVVMTWDGKIFWYEALMLFIGYIIYIAIMFQNHRLSKFVDYLVEKFNKKEETIIKEAPVKLSISTITSQNLEGPRYRFKESTDVQIEKNVTDDIDENYTIFKRPKGTLPQKIYFYYTWPIRLVLYYTVPDSRKFPRLFPATFVICVIFIGCNSYIVSWMITIIGFAFGIPDAILGLTFLAAGGCLGESVSIAIMSRKGEGKMGVSNALGANTMNILLSLGLPWFIKTLVEGADEDSFINIESGSMEYTILALIMVAIALYLVLSLNKFKLSKLTGIITLVIYLIFLSLAIVFDLVIFSEKECN